MKRNKAVVHLNLVRRSANDAVRIAVERVMFGFAPERTSCDAMGCCDSRAVVVRIVGDAVRSNNLAHLTLPQSQQ